MPFDPDSRLHPLNAGSRRMARDPARIYEEAESGSCVGCAFIVVITIAGHAQYACGRNRQYGKRCKAYAEREAPNARG